VSAEKGIWINQQFLSYSQIRVRNNYSEFEAYFQQSLDICHRWLNGITTLEIKTSGSTGTPKTIELNRDQLISSIEATRVALGLNSKDHALVCINTQYIGGIMMMLRCIEIQMDMTIVYPSSNPLESTIHIFDFIALVPLQLEKLILNGFLDQLNKSKVIIIGGAPLIDSIEKKIQSITTPCYHTYGMTETASHFALKRLNGTEKKPYFECLPGVEIQKTKEELLQVRGKITKGKWITTHDRVELISSHSFVWKGREDEVINSGGVKLYIPDLENEINQLFEQRLNQPTFFLSSISDAQLGQKLVMIIEGKPQSNLLEYLKGNLKEFHSPKEIYYVDKIPRTETGKIKKKEALKTLSIL